MAVKHHRLVQLGYGTLGEVRQMNSRDVLQALAYDDFLADYHDKFLELNKP